MPELVKRFPSDTPVLMYTQEEVVALLLAFVALDQTTVQHIINGAPQFDEGLTVKKDKWVNLDGE